MKKRILFSFIIAVIVFITAFSIICPNIDLETLISDGNYAAKITPSVGKVISAGSISEDGSVKVLSETPCVIEYSVNSPNIRCVKIVFNKQIEEDISFAVENTSDGTFVDNEVVYANMHRKDSYVCVPFKENNITAIRIWFHEDCTVNGIYYYTSPPIAVGKPLNLESWRYLLTVSISLFTFLFVFILDKFLNIYGKTCDFLNRKKSRILFFFIGNAIAVGIAAIAELAIRAIIGVDSVGSRFNVASFCLIACILILSFVFYFERKNIALNPEKLVALIILAVGFLIIFTEPFSHNSSDEDSHYNWAVHNSFFKEAHLSTADYCARHTIDFSLSKKDQLAGSLDRTEILNSRDNYATSKTEVDRKLTHIPSGVFIALSRLFGANFRTKFMCGQFAMLLLYVSVVYFAIKKLNSGKMIMSIIALFPTNILLACNYSYDAWVTSLTLLGTSYFINQIEQPEKHIKMRDTVIMCVAFMLASVPKPVYAIFLFLPLFIRRNWQDKREKKLYFSIILLSIIFMLLFLAVRSLAIIESGGDVRGGDVNTILQIKYILGNPIEYTIKLTKFLCEYLSPLNAHKYITFFSYLGNGKTAGVFIIALTFCAITDKNHCCFKGYRSIKIVVIIIDIVLASMLATALYIAFSPVASEKILGCNPRYLVPLLAPFVLTVGNPGTKIIKNRFAYNFIVLTVITICLAFDVLTVVTIPMF